jgi:hypothetical protein
MISKRRPLLYDVLGGQSRSATRPARASGPLPGHRGSVSRGFVAAIVVAVALVGTIAGLRIASAGGDPGVPPLLQTKVPDVQPEPRGPEVTQPRRGAHAVCAITFTWDDSKQGRTRKAMLERVQEIVDFLAYHPDPDFHDVRAVAVAGRKQGTGYYYVYVGSAERRPALQPLADKIKLVEFKGRRPFGDAWPTLEERPKK